MFIKNQSITLILLSLTPNLIKSLSIPNLGLTSSCQTTAIGLATGDFGTCADINGLLGVVQTDGSIVKPLDTWLNGLCSSTCSNSTLTTTANSVETGCSTDLSNGNTIALGLNLVSNNYTTIKNSLCLTVSSNNSFCLTNTLSALETATNQTLTVSFLSNLISSDPTTFLTSIPKGAICTDCIHALYTSLSPLLTSLSGNNSTTTTSSNSTMDGIESECGTNFGDGKIPNGIRTSNGNGTSSSSNSNSTSNSGSDRIGGKGGNSFMIGLVGIGFGVGWFMI